MIQGFMIYYDRDMIQDEEITDGAFTRFDGDLSKGKRGIDRTWKEGKDDWAKNINIAKKKVNNFI